jgi:hypothetical protein
LLGTFLASYRTSVCCYWLMIYQLFPYYNICWILESGCREINFVSCHLATIHMLLWFFGNKHSFGHCLQGSIMCETEVQDCYLERWEMLDVRLLPDEEHGLLWLLITMLIFSSILVLVLVVSSANWHVFFFISHFLTNFIPALSVKAPGHFLNLNAININYSALHTFGSIDRCMTMRDSFNLCS